MILLGQHSEPRALQGAADYFKSQGIKVKLTYLDNRTAQVWVSEHDAERATLLWQEFLSNPYHERYLAASWQTGDTQVKFNYMGKDLNLAKRFVGLHWFLKLTFIVCISVFASFFLVQNPQSWLDKLLFNPTEPLSWLTPAIIHFGALHLIFNLSWWLYLGNKIVKQAGSSSLFLLFFISALVSNWAQYLIVDNRFGGLSGVVYALLGFAWIYSTKLPEEKQLITKPIVGFMLVWMVLGFADVLFISMANWAHLFGLLSGMAIAALQLPKSKRD